MPIAIRLQTLNEAGSGTGGANEKSTQAAPSAPVPTNWPFGKVEFALKRNAKRPSVGAKEAFDEVNVPMKTVAWDAVEKDALAGVNESVKVGVKEKLPLVVVNVTKFGVETAACDSGMMAGSLNPAKLSVSPGANPVLPGGTVNPPFTVRVLAGTVKLHVVVLSTNVKVPGVVTLPMAKTWMGATTDPWAGLHTTKAHRLVRSRRHRSTCMKALALRDISAASGPLSCPALAQLHAFATR